MHAQQVIKTVMEAAFAAYQRRVDAHPAGYCSGDGGGLRSSGAAIPAAGRGCWPGRELVHDALKPFLTQLSRERG